MGASPHPAESNEAPVACPDWIYNNRNVVERLWARLKEWRAVATRYEKTSRSFMAYFVLRLLSIGSALTHPKGISVFVRVPLAELGRMVPSGIKKRLRGASKRFRYKKL
jgi:hypothetical protein